MTRQLGAGPDLEGADLVDVGSDKAFHKEVPNKARVGVNFRSPISEDQVRVQSRIPAPHQHPYLCSKSHILLTLATCAARVHAITPENKPDNTDS